MPVLKPLTEEEYAEMRIRDYDKRMESLEYEAAAQQRMLKKTTRPKKKSSSRKTVKKRKN